MLLISLLLVLLVAVSGEGGIRARARLWSDLLLLLIVDFNLGGSDLGDLGGCHQLFLDQVFKSCESGRPDVGGQAKKDEGMLLEIFRHLELKVLQDEPVEPLDNGGIVRVRVWIIRFAQSKSSY